MLSQLNHNECLNLLREKKKSINMFVVKRNEQLFLFSTKKNYISSVWFRKLKILSLLFMNYVVLQPLQSLDLQGALGQLVAKFIIVGGSQLLQVWGHGSHLGKHRMLPLDQEWRRSRAKGKTLDLPVCLYSNPHLWPWEAYCGEMSLKSELG